MELALSLDSQERLQSILVQMQHRTYLWLYLTINEIRETFQNSLDPDSVTIKSLSQSVGEAYERLLQRIDLKQRSNARQILLIIVGARRPLTVGEMAWALGAARAEQAQSQCVESLNVQHLENQIRLWCGLFVFIQHSTLFLIHQTAKEFLLSTDLDSALRPDTWQGSLHSRQVELEMLKMCTVYLCSAPESAYGNDGYQHMVKSMSQESQDQSLGVINPCVSFFQYCAEYWPAHSSNDLSATGSPLFDRVLALYDDQSNLLAAWFGHFRNVSRLYSDMPEILSQHVIAFNGHHSVLRHLYRERPFDLSKKDTRGHTALYYAAEQGHTEAVRWLVAMGADVDARVAWDNTTALQAASRGGHTQIVQMLLGKGAGDYNGALQEASGGGHMQVVQVLRSRGACYRDNTKNDKEGDDCSSTQRINL